MKQGRASRDVQESGKVEPKPHAMSPGAVSRLGIMQGPRTIREPMHIGRGYKAPMAGHDCHPSGSQGKHK